MDVIAFFSEKIYTYKNCMHQNNFEDLNLCSRIKILCLVMKFRNKFDFKTIKNITQSIDLCRNEI